MPTEEATHREPATELEELDAKKLRQDCMNIMSNGNSNEVSPTLSFVRDKKLDPEDIMYII